MSIEEILLTEPLWQEKDLGQPLPPTVHAVSAAFPLWQNVVDYEEGVEAVTSSLRAAYPRFFFHPLVLKLFKKCEEKFAGDGEFCFAFPSGKVAKECLDYIKKRTGLSGKIDKYNNEIYVTTFPLAARDSAKSFWQHVGQIISSRLAEAALNGDEIKPSDKEKQIIKERIAKLAGEKAEDIFLFTSGMAGIFTVHKALSLISSGCKTIQLGFPYVDTLKIQEQFGAGSHFITGKDYLDKIKSIVESEKIAGLFCEFPNNPLLGSVDLKALSSLLREYGIPLVIDDTIATWVNVDLKPYADITATSLTKFFSGVGDVMAGSIALNSASPFYTELKNKVSDIYEDLLFSEDAKVLEKNSGDFEQRMKEINKTAEELCDFLNSHPKVKKIHYPKYVDREVYDGLEKDNGGYGGLFSIELKNPAQAPAFYDNLRVSKGPSLGTNFTLACPYTLLAHYNELEFARSHGVNAELVRVSVGLERAEDLIERFNSALNKK